MIILVFFDANFPTRNLLFEIKLELKLELIGERKNTFF